MYTFWQFFYFVYGLVIILATGIAGTVLIKKEWRFSYKLLLYLVWVTFIVELVSFVANIVMQNGIPWIYNIFMPIETVIIVYFLTHEAKHSMVRRLYNWLFLYIVIELIVAYSLQKWSFRYSNTHQVLFAQFAYLIAACAVIVDVLIRNDDTPIARVPVFWVAAGILVSASLFGILFSIGFKWLYASKTIYMSFSYVANTFQYGSFTVAFILYNRSLDRKKVFR